VRRLLLLLPLAGCVVIPAPSVEEDDAQVVDDDDAADDDDVVADDDDDLGSRCAIDDLGVACAHETTTLDTGWSSLSLREVHHQTPRGEAPPDGWPVAVLFQGSIFSAETFWAALNTDAFGYMNQGLVVATLLDAGYAVVTPEAHLEGFTAWDTNIPPWSTNWDTSADHAFMTAIFGAIEGGTFGDLDPDRLYASGISSGGYMTSRMALSYPGRFRALVVHSGSWATCAGAVCTVPRSLPRDHPPVLFLHGEDDDVVPPETMESYLERLHDRGLEADAVVVPGVRHAWIDGAGDRLLAHFDAHP